MGVLNVTPDSFSDGGKLPAVEDAVGHAMRMEAEGASIIDVGGESTRPGSKPVGLDEELHRVIPVIRGIRSRSEVVISIDTMKAGVAEAAIEAGADIVNDVSAFRADEVMVSVAARWKAGVVLMHMQGNPATMQQAPAYGDVVVEVEGFLRERLAAVECAGVDPEAVALDPGIGFGKLPAHNLALLRATPVLCRIGRPILLGVSRKSFLGWIASAPEIEDRFWPGVALTSLGREMGARIFRIHDPGAHHQALRMTEAILGEPSTRQAA
ncbi:MAG: dihydropteroate synthase [Terrimicrobiaceae bacterium]